MTDQVVIALNWLTPDQGGRQVLPTGPTYTTVATFRQQSMEDWLGEAWSLVIEFLEPPAYGRKCRASARYLNEGPEGWLRPGILSNSKKARRPSRLAECCAASYAKNISLRIRARRRPYGHVPGRETDDDHHLPLTHP